MSVKRELLTGEDCDALVRFFDKVLGWSVNPVRSAPGKALVVGWDSYAPALFLLASDEQMSASAHDYVAVGVDSVGDLMQIHARAEAFAATDPRAQVTGRSIDDYKVGLLHSIFVRFLMPLLVEVQHLEVRAR
jgi:hypothetical protein